MTASFHLINLLEWLTEFRETLSLVIGLSYKARTQEQTGEMGGQIEGHRAPTPSPAGPLSLNLHYFINSEAMNPVLLGF